MLALTFHLNSSWVTFFRFFEMIMWTGKLKCIVPSASCDYAIIRSQNANLNSIYACVHFQFITRHLTIQFHDKSYSGEIPCKSQARVHFLSSAIKKISSHFWKSLSRWIKSWFWVILIYSLRFLHVSMFLALWWILFAGLLPWWFTLIYVLCAFKKRHRRRGSPHKLVLPPPPTLQNKEPLSQ